MSYEEVLGMRTLERGWYYKMAGKLDDPQ